MSDIILVAMSPRGDYVLLLHEEVYTVMLPYHSYVIEETDVEVYISNAGLSRLDEAYTSLELLAVRVNERIDNHLKDLRLR